VKTCANLWQAKTVKKLPMRESMLTLRP